MPESHPQLIAPKPQSPAVQNSIPVLEETPIPPERKVRATSIDFLTEEEHRHRAGHLISTRRVGTVQEPPAVLFQTQRQKMNQLDLQKLEEAFRGRDDIIGAIKNASAAPSAAGAAYNQLFNAISAHICTLLTPSTPSEPASKKRRLDGDVPSRPANSTNSHAFSNGSAAANDNGPILLEVKDISVIIPQRKKYTLCFTSTHIYAQLPDSPEPVAGISFAWTDIEHVFRLPVPDKSQKQHNYILFPINSTIAPAKPVPGAAPIPEPLVFTIADTAPKAGTISGTEAATAATVSDDYKTLFDWAIMGRLEAAGRRHVKIVEADEKLFHSVQRQAHRPKEKAVHVNAHRGSKDGYLFFLPNGILWAFKKPLLFLAHNRIAAVSYTNVLQRTFNLSVEMDTSSSSDEEKGEEFEFSMVDQEDFAGIDGYIKRHGLQDTSMAEQRKAKRLNVNVVKDEEGNVISNGDAGELEAAAQQLEDEEDEEEEDYDPGSEGESEGSGSSSEEEDEDGGG